jgi:hypothetical protein
MGSDEIGDATGSLESDDTTFISLEKMAPATVIPIKVSETEVTVNCRVSGGKKSILKKLEIPAGYKNLHIMRNVILYLQSKDFLAKSPLTRNAEVTRQTKFFAFIAKQTQYLNDGVPLNVYEEYLRYRKKEAKISFYGEMLHIVEPTKWLLRQKNHALLPVFTPDFVSYLAFAPDIPNPKDNSTPKPSLVDLFGARNCPYNDTDMIKALRLACCFICEKLDSMRSDLLQNKVLQQWIDTLKTNNLLNHKFSEYYQPCLSINNKAISSKINADNYQIIQDAYNHLYKVILEQANPLTIELLYQHELPAATNVDSKTAKLAWAKRFFNREKGKIVTFSIPTKLVQIVSLSALTFRFLNRPTDIETFSIQCLLAAESIQREGLTQHTLADFSITDKSLQLGYGKGRRDANSATAIYSRKNIVHDTLKNYHDLMSEIQTTLPEPEQGKTFAYKNEKIGAGIISSCSNELNSFMSLLLDRKTQLNAKFSEEVGDEGKPFLWLLDKLVKHNNKHVLENNEQAKKISARKKRGLNKIKLKSKHSRIALTPDAISMSRKRMDDSTNVYQKGSEPTHDTDSNGSAEVKAELTAHSVAVKANVYNDRSNSPQKIESQCRFGAQVGDLYEKEALKISEYIKNAKIVDMQQVRKILDISNSRDEFEEMLESLDLDTEIWGGINHQGQTLIVTTKMTAALITGYIAHIKKELPSVRLDSEKKASALRINLAYLSEMLEQFPPHLQQAGKYMQAEFDIPYPSLL